MKGNILVSIIVPVYGVEEYIEKCLASLVNQTYQHIEILLIDDGSVDKSGEICDGWEKKDSRIKVFHKENEGLGLTRNYGMDRARGDYVIFQDSDDYASVDMVEKLLVAQVQNNADTVIGGYSRFRDDRIIYTEQYQSEVYHGERVKNELLPRFIGSMPDKKDGLFQTAWGKLYSLNIIRQNQLSFVSEREWIGEDFLFQFDYFRFSRTAVVTQDIVYFYRENGDSLTGRYREDRFLREKEMYLYLREKFKEFNWPEREKLRYGKLLLVQMRGVLEGEINVSGKKRRTCEKSIKQILNDEIVNEVLADYPIRKLKFAQKCFAYMIQYKCVKALYVSIRLRARIGNKL